MQFRFLLALLLMISVPVSAAIADEYPSGPIRVVVPFGAGTSTDITSRAFIKGLAEQLKQAMVIDNRPGAGGNIGTDIVAKAKPDGYTLCSGTVGTFAINVSLYRKIPFDPLRDFIPISLYGLTPTLLVVKPDSPFKNVMDIVTYAKKNPGKLTFASAGNGTTGHLGGELLKTLSGTSMVHVPYKQGTQAMTEIMSGQVDFLFYHPSAVMPHVSSGRMKAIACSSDKRSISAPNVPTVAESGFPDFNLTGWRMIAAPAATPREVVDKLVKASELTLKNPEVVQRLHGLGLEQAEIKATDLPGFLAKEVATWSKVIKASGAHVE